MPVLWDTQLVDFLPVKCEFNNVWEFTRTVPPPFCEWAHMSFVYIPSYVMTVHVHREQPVFSSHSARHRNLSVTVKHTVSGLTKLTITRTFTEIKPYQHKHCHTQFIFILKNLSYFMLISGPFYSAQGWLLSEAGVVSQGCSEACMTCIYIKKKGEGEKKRSTHLRVCGASMAYGLHARSSISRCSLCLPGAATQSLSFISDGFL